MQVIIIGGGQAAASTAQQFRKRNDKAALMIISEEAHPPYQRPPLSKSYLAGEIELERLYLRPKSWYEENNVNLMLNTKVKAVDLGSRKLTLENGDVRAFDKLVFATGGRPRQLPKSVTHGAKNVYSVRNLDDIDALIPQFENGKKLFIIGGGYIGLEAAAIARKFELEVTLVEVAPRILGRVASELTAKYIRDTHLKRGVNVLEGAEIERYEVENDQLTRAHLINGDTIEFDFMIVGIGISPNDELAKTAGVKCDDGILVNEYCETNIPDVYAAGDCTRFEYRGENLRIESVGNAIDQGLVVGNNLAGERTRYEPKAWFWSDQYDLNLQIAGLNLGYDDVVLRGDLEAGTLSIWYYQGEKLLAVDAINDPRAYMIAKRVIDAGKSIPKDAARDPEADLKAFLKP